VYRKPKSERSDDEVRPRWRLNELVASSDALVNSLRGDLPAKMGPVFVGDTIYAESERLAKRESASRPDQGLLTVRTIGKKGDGTQFMSFERTALIAKRGHGIKD
jgi:itaconyl-CoA hydratase